MKRIRAVRNIQLGVKTLMLHKLRSFLTILGVVFGVGSVIAMLAVGEGASKEALEQIRKAIAVATRSCGATSTVTSSSDSWL